MVFRKGHKIFLGRKHTEATKKKMSSVQKGRVLTPEHRAKISESRTGKRHSREARAKMSASRMGTGNHFFGKKHTIETRLKQSLVKLGDKSPNWKGGVTPLHKKVRSTFQYRLWKNAVKERDKYACTWCGSKDNIEADHIKPFAYFPELRFAIDNGRTLCRPCHKKTDSYGKYEK